MVTTRTGGRRLPPPVLVSLLVALGIAAPAAGIVSPPELGWRLKPGDGEGSEDSQTAEAGPIGATRANSLPGVVSDGSTSADYGALAARTSTTVNAGQQTGESFCYPLPPAPQCSEAEAWWADRLVFTAPGLLANGTEGSFTARVAISGQLAAALSSQWDFVPVEADYQALVEVDGITLEQIGVGCQALPLPGMDCIPVPLQIYYGDPPQQKTPPTSGFGTFELGPYDFTWGQPFAFEVRLLANTSLYSVDQTSGTSSASANLGNTLVWSGVVQMFDGPGGSGSPVPLGAARVWPESGVDWLGTVAVPEPGQWLLAFAALGTLAALVARRRARG